MRVGAPHGVCAALALYAVSRPTVSYRINRQLSGWILPPLMIRASGRTARTGLLQCSKHAHEFDYLTCLMRHKDR
jgi:hypothetical protein